MAFFPTSLTKILLKASRQTIHYISKQECTIEKGLIYLISKFLF